MMFPNRRKNVYYNVTCVQSKLAMMPLVSYEDTADMMKQIQIQIVIRCSIASQRNITSAH